MDLTGKSVWQVGAGDGNRRYDDICLEYGLILLGPSGPGRYSPEKYTEIEPGSAKIVQRFYDKPRAGDLVLLRLGVKEILAVGEIAEDRPVYNEAFADIDGWDIAHTRRVRWFDISERDLGACVYGARGDRFSGVHQDRVLDWLESLQCNRSPRNSTPPESGKILDWERIVKALLLAGTPSDTVARFQKAITELTKLEDWYRSSKRYPRKRPSEHETVAYMVLPLLFSLGWSEQTAAVEWKNMDIALFKKMSSADGEPIVIVEAKKRKRSVVKSLKQALGYVADHESVEKIILTDGVRYAVHQVVSRDPLDTDLLAYFNIMRPCSEYPVLHCAGAVRAILEMAQQN